MRRTSHLDGDLRILLVEDNPFDSELIEIALQAQLGCQITTVTSKLAFEAALKQNVPDFIISDSNLPSFNGLAALALSGQICPHVPFIVCSGNISEETKAEALAQGAVDCISKYDLDSMVALIGRLAREAKQDGGDIPEQN